MKKLLALLLVFLMLTLTFTACTEDNNASSKPDNPSSDVSSDEAPSDDDSDIAEDDGESEPEETIDTELQDEEPQDEEPQYEDDGEYDDPLDEEEIEDVPLTPEQQRVQDILAGVDEEINKDALYNEGNLTRLAKAINKSKAGKEVTLLFYGNGTNTGRGIDRSTDGATYAMLVQDWWETNIGPCKYIKSGTDNLVSTTACLRVDYDVLRYEPDVVFLDFAVQDGISAMAKSNALGYDNLIRRILHSESAPAVISLMLTGAEQQSYTMNPKNATIFASASAEQKKVAKYYDLPIIDFEQSFWDNSIEIVEVTSKKEIPLLTWENISLDNTIMNQDGHMVLAGTIKYFLSNVVKKLNKISTKNYTYPTDGFFGNDKYMNSTFVSIGDIVEGKIDGYSMNLDTLELAKNSYVYASENEGNSMTPNIKTWRHFDYIEGTHDAKWETYEENEEFLTINFPKVVEDEIYVLFATTKTVGDKIPSGSPMQKYGPITVECYSENGTLLSSVKPSTGHFTETTQLGKSSAVKLSSGTAQITIKTYTSSGSIYIQGLSYLTK